MQSAQSGFYSRKEHRDDRRSPGRWGHSRLLGPVSELKRIVSGVLLCVTAAGSARAAESPANLVARGNQLYEQKTYDKAELAYKDAQKLLPESPEINFNLGSVAYRKGDYDAAEDCFNKAAESPDASRELRKKALYDLGNCAFMKAEKLLDSDLQKALDHYKLSILRYQDVLAKDEQDDIRSSERGSSDEDAKFNIEVARLKIKDILDKLKQQEEKQKEQQKKQEEFIKKLKEAIEKQEQIVKDTEGAQQRKQAGEDASRSVEDVTKRQVENKKTTNELSQELQQQIDAAKSQSGTGSQPPVPIDENVAAANDSLKVAEIEEGTALQHLDKQDLAEAKNREEAALQHLQDALDKLTKPQQPQPQPQPGEEQQQSGQGQKKEQEQKQQQPGKEQEKKDQGQEKMTPQEAQEELAKLRKQAGEMRKQNLEEFRRRRPDYRQPRREYEPVDKDW